MTDFDRAHSERVLTALLLMGVVLTGVALAREGVHFDNTIAGDRLFMIAFFGGAIVGFVGWTRYTGATPALSLSGPNVQLWLATAVVAFVSTASASYVNRTFATPTERSSTAAIDSIREGKGTRWHVVVSVDDGRRERYLITEQTALQLKDAKAVRMRYARGVLGFDYIAEFEPIKP
jgi:membrane protein implicated in regulation of membrane protease activity